MTVLIHVSLITTEGNSFFFFFSWLSAFCIDFFGHACETSCLWFICWEGGVIYWWTKLFEYEICNPCLCLLQGILWFCLFLFAVCTLPFVSALHFLSAEASVVIASDSAGLSFKKKVLLHFKFYLLLLCVHVVHTMACVWRPEDSDRSWFSPPSYGSLV